MLSNFDSAERDYLNNMPETELDERFNLCPCCGNTFEVTDCIDPECAYCDDCYESMKESEEEEDDSEVCK